MGVGILALIKCDLVYWIISDIGKQNVKGRRKR
jgi:hypothetical protein